MSVMLYHCMLCVALLMCLVFFVYHRFSKQAVESCWSSSLVHSFQMTVPGSIPGDVCYVSSFLYYYLEDFYCYNIIISFLRLRLLYLISGCKRLYFDTI